MKTMTLNLTEKEMTILGELAKKKGVSKTALIRQALRLYQAIDVKIEDGYELFTRAPDDFYSLILID